MNLEKAQRCKTTFKKGKVAGKEGSKVFFYFHFFSIRD